MVYLLKMVDLSMAMLVITSSPEACNQRIIPWRLFDGGIFWKIEDILEKKPGKPTKKRWKITIFNR